MSCLQSSFAQPLEWQPRPAFEVLHEGQALLNPFTGGINAPILQFVDIDGDGDTDLFLLDVDGRLNFYENVGTRTSAQFLLRSLNFQDVKVGSWFRFIDIDADGDYDLFCNGPSATVNFYRNVGTQFVLEVEGLKQVNGNPVLSETISVPTFADMDGDGDMDFFSGNSVGSIWYYENIGTPTSFSFRFVTDKYQGIEIIGLSGKIAPRTEASNISKEKRALHGAMAITFADVDGDGDLDLFWGDFFNPSLYFLENRGTPANPQLVLTDSTYPKPAPVATSGFNMPQLVDIDNDGDLDLFIGVLYGATTVDNFQFYRNNGLITASNFQRETENFIQTLDVGAASSPVSADVDGDGDLDLLIGSEDGQLVLYNREGAGGNLRFVLDGTFSVNLAGLFNISPTFGDIDGDGKQDLIVGDANGRLRLYRGTDLSNEDTTFQLRSASFGQNASPVLVEFEQRGLLDLFVGTGGGRIAYYRNTGTPAAPQFVLQTSFFQSIDVGDDAKPVFVDLTGDGILDLVVGSRDNSLSFWRNNGGTMSRIADFFADIQTFPRVAPAFNDVDEDGAPDLFLGNNKGGLYFYKNRREAANGDVGQQVRLYQNFPNPFSHSTTIHYDLPAESWVRLSLFDLLGREVKLLVHRQQSEGRHTAVLDASSVQQLSSGVYLYRLRAGSYVEAKKMQLVK
ncbi:MAG: FG-GAP-like repeat-containing protein [Bacteroidota bacterium]